jgi:ATP-dependent DNA ligase
VTSWLESNLCELLAPGNRDLTRLPLIERHEVMKCVLKLKSLRVRIADYFEASVEDMISAARGQGLEGVVAKRKDSR